jgi:hypothetical protein
LEELIDAFITDPREAKSLKSYLSRNKAEEVCDDLDSGYSGGGSLLCNPD